MPRVAEHEDWQLAVIPPESSRHEHFSQKNQQDSWDPIAEPRFSHLRDDQAFKVPKNIYHHRDDQAFKVPKNIYHHRDDQAFKVPKNIYHHRDGIDHGSFASSSAAQYSSRGEDDYSERKRSLHRDPYLSRGGERSRHSREPRKYDDLHDSFDHSRSRTAEVSHDSLRHRKSRFEVKTSKHRTLTSLRCPEQSEYTKDHFGDSDSSISFDPSREPGSFRYPQPLRTHDRSVAHETVRNYHHSPLLRRRDAEDLYQERDTFRYDYDVEDLCKERYSLRYHAFEDLYRERDTSRHRYDNSFPETNPSTDLDYIRGSDFVRNHDLSPHCDFSRDSEVKVDSFRGEERSEDYSSRIRDQPAHRDNLRSQNSLRHWDYPVRSHKPSRSDSSTSDYAGDGFRDGNGAKGLDSSNPYLSNAVSTCELLTHRKVTCHKKEPRKQSKSRFFVSVEDISKFDSVDRKPVGRPEVLPQGVSNFDIVDKETIEDREVFRQDAQRQRNRFSHESVLSNTVSPRECDTARFFIGRDNKYDDTEGEAMEQDVHFSQDFFPQGSGSSEDRFARSRDRGFNEIVRFGDTNMLPVHDNRRTGIAAVFRSANQQECSVPDRGHTDRRIDGTSSAQAKLRQCGTALERKRKNTQSLPQDWQASSAKQTRPLPSLLDMTIDVNKFANPPSMEGLFEQKEESRISKRAQMKKEKKDRKLDDSVKLRTIQQKLKYWTSNITKSTADDVCSKLIHSVVMAKNISMPFKLEKEEVADYKSGSKIVTSKAMLGKFFLARAVGLGKADVKQECYRMVLDVLVNKDFDEILKQEDIGGEGVRRIYSKCVESMNKSSTNAIPMVDGMSCKQKWQEFIKQVKNLNPETVDVVSRLERALIISHCGLKRHFTCTPFHKRHCCVAYEGKLVIGGALLAQGQGHSTKEAKITTYELAYQRLMTAELSDIMKGITPQDFGKAEDEDFVISIKEINTVEVMGKFERFLKRVQEYSLCEGPCAILSKAGVLYDVPVIIVHKHLPPDSQKFSCEVFLGDVLAGEAQGSFKNAQTEALNEAYKRTLSTPMEKLLTERRRMTREEDLDGLDVVEVLVKGKKQRQDSNVLQLRQFHGRFDEVKGDWREKMVITETEVLDLASRRDRATSILTKSASMSGVLMKCYSEVSSTIWNVWVELQGEILGMGKGHSFVEAKRLASADVLFKLYETQPVLKILSKDPSSRWVTKAQLMKKMKEMPESDFADLDTKYHDKINVTNMADVPEEEKEEKKIKARLMEAASRLMSELKERGNCLEELVFAPEVYGLARTTFGTNSWAQKGLQSMHSKMDDEQYLSVFVQAGVHKILEEMRNRGVACSDRCELVQDRCSLPRHADIAQEVAASHALCRSSKQCCTDDPEEEDTQQLAVPRESVLHSSCLTKKMRIKLEATKREQLMARFALALKEAGIGQTLILSEGEASSAH